MKTKSLVTENRSVEWIEKEDQIESFENDFPIKKGKKWYDYIPFDKLKELLPRLKNIRGSKAKIQFEGFKITSDNNKTIFERNKTFGSRAQVDFMAWYIGSKFLEIIYFKMDGFAKTKLSLLLESQEEEFRVYDDMKTTKEIFRSHVEKFVEGFMSFEDLKGHGHQLLETLGNKTAKEKMAKIFDSMVSPEEINKITSTLNKRQYRGFQASTQGFQVFSGKVDN